MTKATRATSIEYFDEATGTYVPIGSMQQINHPTPDDGTPPIVELTDVEIDWVECWKLWARLAPPP